MTTAGELTLEILDALVGGETPPSTTLNGSVDATTTTLTLAQALPSALAGVVLGVGPEKVKVATVSGLELTVVRGHLTTAVAHGSGTVVMHGWRWFPADVFRAIRDEINSWPEEVYQVKRASATLMEKPTTVAVPGFRRLLDVRDTTYGASLRQIQVYETSSGHKALAHADDLVVELTYGADFDTSTFAWSTDLETVVGVPTSMLDVVRHGVNWRLLSERDAQRSDLTAQPEPRDSMEVREFTTMRSASAHKQLRDARLADESRRLHSLYPPRF